MISEIQISRREVIREIIERDRQKESLAEEEVRRKANELYKAACLNFGAWSTALCYAGVGSQQISALQIHDWKTVINEIRRICTKHCSLSEIRNKQRDPSLYHAAVKFYGSWEKALQAAGVNLSRAFLTPSVQRIDKPTILSKLKERYRCGCSLAWVDLYCEDRPIAAGVKRLYGSLSRALIAAGIPSRLSKIKNKQWNEKRIVDELQARSHNEKTMTYMAVYEDHPRLALIATACFGSWSEALHAAGITIMNTKE